MFSCIYHLFFSCGLIPILLWVLRLGQVPSLSTISYISFIIIKWTTLIKCITIINNLSRIISYSVPNVREHILQTDMLSWIQQAMSPYKQGNAGEHFLQRPFKSKDSKPNPSQAQRLRPVIPAHRILRQEDWLLRVPRLVWARFCFRKLKQIQTHAATSIYSSSPTETIISMCSVFIHSGQTICWGFPVPVFTKARKAAMRLDAALHHNGRQWSPGPDAFA